MNPVIQMCSCNS